MPRKTSQQTLQDIERIKRRIADLEALDPSAIQERRAPEIIALQIAIGETLTKVFGGSNRYMAAARLDNGRGWMSSAKPPVSLVRQWLTEGKSKSVALLSQAVRGLEEDLTDGVAQDDDDAASRPLDQHQIAGSSDIFIVHGRDGPAKVEVARLIERAGLKAVILHEQANQGRTIIEKFEAHGGAAAFAVIVITPDDVGGLDETQLRPRARQNVIGEMFWFAGRLGRDRVCALVKGNIEMPSDFAGVGYAEMDDRGAWKQELLRELQAAGYTDLDWGKALA